MTPFPGSQFLVPILFGIAVAATIGGALLAVLSHRIIRGVCGLALCSIGLAGLFYFLNSPFLALMQILIYVGAVCITIIFAVMLAEPDEPPNGTSRAITRSWDAVAGLVGGLVCAGLVWLALRTPWPVPATRTGDGSVPAIGNALLTTFSLAFELISLVLLVAILGALVLARAGRTRPTS